MKKALILSSVAVVIIAIIAIVIATLSGQDSRTTNDDAEKDKKGRYLTIINDTEQIINEVHITVGDGTEIEEMQQTNPDETSFSIEIPDAYSEYTAFTVTLIDRYDMKYIKEVANVKETGRTEVKISEADYFEEKGDFWDKVDKFFNGD